MNESLQTDANIPMATQQTQLSVMRTNQALDRTTLAWVRTTRTINSFGLGMIAFFRTMRQERETPDTVLLHQRAILLGIALVVLGVAATVLIVITHLKNLGRLRRGEMPVVSRWPLSVTIALLLAPIALGGLWVFVIH